MKAAIQGLRMNIMPPPPPATPLCGVPSGCCFFTGPWTVTHSSLCMLRRAGAPGGAVSVFAEPSGWCAGAVLDVAVCSVCASAAPSNWCTGVVLVVVGVF